MKTLLTTCLAILFSIPFCAYSQWMTDYNAALQKARAEDKAVLINFTGSDWCGWCIKLKDEVFDKQEFKSYAQQNLILLELDFPRKKAQPAAVRAANEKLAGQFLVKGFPTVFILDKNGNRLAKTGYLAGGPKNYIAEINKARGAAANANNAAVQASTPPAAPPKKVEAPAYTIPPPVIRYEDLALKGISGGRVPMALINNKSFAVNEKSKVKVGDKTLEVLVKEIRENSVIVEIEGEPEPRELKLKDRTTATQE